MPNLELAAELIEALKARNRCLDDVNQAVGRLGELKADIRERRERLDAAERTLREIEHELLTGVNPLPLLAAAAGSGGRPREPAGRAAPKSTDEGESDGDVATNLAAPGRADGCQPEYTAGELDRLLIHACRGYYTNMRSFWDASTMNGVSDEDIRDFLVQHWPQGRVYVGPDQTRQKLGYTMSRGGSHPCLWVGAFKGPGHKADLAGDALIARVRFVFGIPRPADSRVGMDLVTSRPGSTPATNGVNVPEKPEPPAKKPRRRKEATDAATTAAP